MDVVKKSNHREFLLLIDKYEEIFEFMIEQICYYKVQQETLKKETQSLILDNKILSKSLGDLSQMENHIASHKNEILPEVVVNNLQNQLSIISQEKNTTFDLWQNSLKIIDRLEAELKIYKGSKQGYICAEELEKVKRQHAMDIKNLQSILKSMTTHEKQKIGKTMEDLETHNNELQKTLKACSTVADKIQGKDTEISVLKKQLHTVLESCEKLRFEIQKQEEMIRQNFRTEQDSRLKVLESIIIVEDALAESEAAMKREKEAKDRIRSLNDTVTHLMEESERKIVKEKEILTEQYKKDLNKLESDKKLIQENLNEKEMQIGILIRKNEVLEEKISKHSQGKVKNDNKDGFRALMCEKNLEPILQKLLISKRCMKQKISESDQIRMDLEKMKEKHKQERRLIETEKQNLEKRIKILQNEVSISNAYVQEYALQINELNAYIIKMKEITKKEIAQNEKNFQNILNERMTDLKIHSGDIQQEFKKHLRVQHNLNRRWQKETKGIVDKLQHKIRKLKTENNNLRNKC